MAAEVHETETVLCSFPRCAEAATEQAGFGVVVHSCRRHAVVFNELGGLARDELNDAVERLAGAAFKRLFAGRI